MRCPTCGTENVPDSRFCGACGAKLIPESRVAPTAKIPDDAPFPAHYGSQAPYTPPPQYQSIPYQPGPASIPPRPASVPPQNGPASIPPQNYQSGPASIPPSSYQAPGSIPPQNGPASIPPNTYQAPASIPPTNAAMYGRAQSVARDPSMSMPVIAQPRWGLIILVLLLDAGLATAGAIMLQKGLAKPETTEAPAPAPAPGSATPPKAAMQPSPSPTVAANIAAIAEKVPDPDPKLDDKGSAKPVATKKPPTTKVGPAPQDPYDSDKALHTEIELAAARSRDDFNKCRDDAGEVRGRIDIGFTVEPDGRVDRIRIGSNTTGSQPLASCLQAAVSRWAFATHPSQASEFVRPFIY